MWIRSARKIKASSTTCLRVIQGQHLSFSQQVDGLFPIRHTRIEVVKLPRCVERGHTSAIVFCSLCSQTYPFLSFSLFLHFLFYLSTRCRESFFAINDALSLDVSCLWQSWAKFLYHIIELTWPVLHGVIFSLQFLTFYYSRCCSFFQKLCPIVCWSPCRSCCAASETAEFIHFCYIYYYYYIYSYFKYINPTQVICKQIWQKFHKTQKSAYDQDVHR